MNRILGLLTVLAVFSATSTYAFARNRCVLKINVPELKLELSQSSLGLERDIAACVFEIDNSLRANRLRVGNLKQFQDQDGFADGAQLKMFDYCIKQANACRSR